MAYLVVSDYKKQIQNDNLSQIIGNDFEQLKATELRAVQELTSYLIQKYNMPAELTSTLVWATNTAYKAKQRFVLTAAPFSPTVLYAAGVLVAYEGTVYRCNATLTVAGPFSPAAWTSLGTLNSFFVSKTPVNEWLPENNYVTGNTVFWNDSVYTALTTSTGKQPDQNAAIWGAGTLYTLPNGVLPDSVYFTQGDNRNQQIVGAIVDIVLYHLHSRIAPNNVPALRYDRYKDVVSWLKNCARGDDYTLDVPRHAPLRGMRNRSGNAQTKSNNQI